MNETIVNPYIISGLAGMIAAALVVYYLGRKRPALKGHLALCYLSAIAGMFIGAHLLFFIVGLPDFAEKYGSGIYDIQSFLTAIFDAASGMVFYGGLFGATLGVLIFCRIARIDSRLYLDTACCAFPMLHAFGRIGCALGGCCYGIEYHGIFAIQYTAAHINPGISDHIADFPRFPVQPMEAVFEFAISFLLISLYLKNKRRYALITVYFFIYGIIRFLDEFLRGDEVRGIWGPFSTSQWIALCCIIGSGIYFILRKRSLCKAAAESDN